MLFVFITLHLDLVLVLKVSEFLLLRVYLCLYRSLLLYDLFLFE